MFKPKVITSKNKTNSKLLERTTVMAATSSSPSQHCRVSTRLWFSPIPSTPSNYGSHKLFPARSQNCCFTPNTCVQIRNERQASTSGELFLVGILQHEAQVTHTHTLSADHHLTGMPLWNIHSWPTPWFCTQHLIKPKNNKPKINQSTPTAFWKLQRT